jgi:F-type H+-transporting ATPase subunit b
MSTNSAAGNFLLPNGTFLVELLAFVLMLWVIARFVWPRLNAAMVARQEAIRQRFAEMEQAKAEAKAMEEKYRSQMAEARHEAARIREEAREQGAQIIVEMREQAQAEAARITSAAHAQITAERQQVFAQLRSELGALAADLAGRIVGESLEDEARRRRTVEHFLDDLDQQPAVSSDSTGADGQPSASSAAAPVGQS